MGHAININGLSKHYPGFTLSDVSFGFERGSVMGFIGRNGAGKTTTIKLIMGLILKDEGEIEVLGQEMGIDSSEIREKIGLTREHTARLMKKLYKDGYLERDTHKMPYIYRLKEEMQKILKRREAKAS